MSRSLLRTLMTFVLLATLLLLGTIGACYAVYSGSVQRGVHVAASDALRDAAFHLSATMDGLTESAAFIAAQTELSHFAQGGAGERLALLQYVRALLTSFANFQTPVVNAYFYTRDRSSVSGQPENDLAFGNATLSLYRGLAYEFAMASPFRDAWVTRAFAAETGAPLFAILTPVYTKFYAPRDSDYMGCLTTLCDMEWFWSTYPLAAGHHLLVTRGDEVYYATEEALARAWRRDPAVASLNVGGTAYRVLSSPADAEGFEVRLAYAVGVFSQGNRQALAFIIIIGLGTLLTHAALMLLLYRALILPIRGIARQADSIHDDLSRIHTPGEAHIELSMLTGSLNGMLERICQLNEDMLAIRLKYLRSHVLLLQGQINPHFLYNNLECIRGMAASGNERLVREMVSCVANLYRYSSRPEHTVTVHEELYCIGLYRRILGMRYDGRYTLDAEATPEAEGRAMLRMTLQPLIENSIRHGFEAGNRTHGRVSIHAYVEDDILRVVVSDDGQGMSREELDRFNALSVPAGGDTLDGHIGITNVYSRIRLIFGADSAMRFASNAEGGLTITVSIHKK
ncbi:histidine kinase [Eubacteriales bacterium OttesenSCG-928-A19]|nr:histidine kinase [Eubacteriales bacterium OttesenSCG-928-A19]